MTQNAKNPVLEFFRDGSACLARDFVWGGVTVPAGFVTDGLSVFKAGRWYASPYGPGLRAGLLHDYDYLAQDKSRKEADDLFYHRLISLGYRRSKAYVMWMFVRIGGWKAWRDHDRGGGVASRRQP